MLSAGGDVSKSGDSGLQRGGLMAAGAEAELKGALGTAGKHERKVVLKAARNRLIEKLTEGLEDEEAISALTSDAKKAGKKAKVKAKIAIKQIFPYEFFKNFL